MGPRAPAVRRDARASIPDGESNPPLFYVLEWGWTRVFGDGEAGLRSLSALAGLLTVPVAYAIGAARAGGVARAGLAAAALVAVNPLLVWFSQEARSYALATLLSAVALLLILRVEDDRRGRVLAGWALAAALALATHYFTAFVLAPQAVWLLWRHPRRRARGRRRSAALAAAGLALLPLLLAQSGNPYDIAGTSLALRLAQVPKQFLLGYRGPLALPFGLLGGRSSLQRHLAAAAAHAARRRASARCCSPRSALVGVALPLLAALGGADYLNTRNVLPALIPLLAALAVGCAACDRPRAGLALLAALCAISLAIVVGVAADGQYQRPDWRGLARALGPGPAGGARAIVVSPANGELALRYYRRGLRTMAAGGADVARGRRGRRRRLARPGQSAASCRRSSAPRSASPASSRRARAHRHLRAVALPRRRRRARARSARPAQRAALRQAVRVDRRAAGRALSGDAPQHRQLRDRSRELRGSRSGGPWPKHTSAGSSAAMRRADSRLRAGSGLKLVERLLDRAAQQEGVEAPHHVAADERAVRLAPVGDVAGGVAGRVEHREAGDLVALAQTSRDRVRLRGWQHAPARARPSCRARLPRRRRRRTTSGCRAGRRSRGWSRSGPGARA